MKKNLLLALSLVFIALGTMFLNPSKVEAVSVTTTMAPRVHKDIVIGGENNWPHSTGACYCGCYAKCHPFGYTDSHGAQHIFPEAEGFLPEGGVYICRQ